MLKAMHSIPPRTISISGVNSVRVRTIDDYARFSLRIAPKNLANASRCFGCDLPRQIGAMAASAERLVLCLGPDEWQLSAPLNEANVIQTEFAAIYSDCAHSLVDIGCRETAIQVEGPAAALLLASGCPLDLATMPPRTGTRTVFDKTQIVLTKYEETRYRIEVWRSFAPHIWGILEAATHEIRLGI
jgi:sarcosine oxidase subunit gamma